MAEISNLSESWEGHTGSEVEQYIKGKLQEHDSGINDAVRNVDTQLDSTSESPVSNAAITQAIGLIEDKTLDSFDVEDNDDGDTVRLTALNKNNQIIASIDLPKGGGGEDTSTTKPRVTASIDKVQVKVGGEATLTYFYDHTNSDGESDGIRATIDITIARGTVEIYSSTIENVAAGTTATLDISPYLLAGTVEVYVKATCTNTDGIVQTKQAFTSIYVVSLSLSSSFDISTSLVNGGYGNDNVAIPYTITGTGTKIVTMYLDGEQYSSDTVSRGGTTNGNFILDASALTSGRHNIQLVAEKDGLYSESIYMDILKSGSESPYIGTKIIFDDGRIYTSSLIPTININQYGQFSINYVVWNPSNITSGMNVLVNGEQKQAITVNRQLQIYTDKYDASGLFAMTFVCGATSYPFNVDVVETPIDAAETTADLQLKLSASGRSNGEANPADWGGITTFSNCDFDSSGWDGETLALLNGAKAVIDYKPFETDATINGLTIETEIMVDNVIDKDAKVFSCIDNGMGVEITTDEAHFYTGSTKQIQTAETDDDGNYIYRERPVGVAMKFASGLWLKIAFVLHTRKDNNLMELYINGVRSKADIYGSGDVFTHSTPQGITIDSTGADVKIRNLRIYNRALSDDEELDNYIVDRPSSAEMLSLYSANNVFGENGKISADILRSQGKGVVIFVRANALDDVNAANDKKKDFLANKVYWYSPYGSEYDFVAENIYFRIQGTSSTKYPRKNYRLYLAKGESPTLTVNGEVVDSHKYAMRPESIPMNLFCLKADFSDSSMVMNTGGAKLFDNVMRQLGLTTPPQEYNTKIRQAIDGIPCDVFCATEEGGELTYYGQYNFNNEKSKSGKLFGMEGVSGFTPACPITLESLNNSNPCCLFQAPKQNIESWFNTYFDDGFEFNYPEDVFWVSETAASKGGTTATSTQKTAIRRLMTWIATVTPSDADTNDISSFVSAQFKSEVNQYFNVQYLLTYYLITDYWGSIDQRSKNILWRTWDGNLWWPTFYDGDSAMGIRNDSFLAYLYDMTRDTWDDEALKYAFEGHDSYLWCLVLANLSDELKTACDSLRGILTTNKMLEMFNGEQQSNWCERIYNKSGEFKYIIPQIEGVPVDGYDEKVKYSYMYALTGNRGAHRTYFLRERGKLLDAQYGTSGFQADNIDIYVSRNASDSADTITILSGDLYYFGYRTNNGGWLDGPIRAEKGGEVTLTFTAALAINDPVRLCGASKIKELDMRNISGHVLRQLGLNKCTMLRKLVFNTEITGNSNSNWYIDWSGCTQLEYVDLTGQSSVTTNDGGSEINLSNQNKLRTLLLGDTNVTSVSLFNGAPIEKLILPTSIASLTLRNLPLLTMDNLTLQGCDNVLRFWFASCPYLDWQTLLDGCPNAQYVRVEGVNGIIRSSVLDKYKNYQGIDANGNVVSSCRLVGSVVLEDIVDNTTLLALQSAYPELTIKNAQFSHYWFDDSETDPANVTNEDNQTGYAYITEDDTVTAKYTLSGHVANIIDASQLVSGYINPKTHKMHVELLNKTNFSHKADGTEFDPSDPNEEMYDVFVYLPHYWYKGVNEYKNSYKHFFVSSNENCPESTATITNKYTMSNLIYANENVIDIRMLEENADNYIDSMLVEHTSYMVCKVNVFQMKQVRFPSVESAFYGYAFTDGTGKVINSGILTTVSSSANPSDFSATIGDYDFRDVPAGAAWLYFTCSVAIDQSIEAITTNSKELEAIEPDWVEHKSELIGVYRGSAGNYAVAGSIPTTGLRSISDTDVICPTQTVNSLSSKWEFDENGNPTGLPTQNITWMVLDFYCLAAIRNLNVENGEYHLMPYETYKDILNLEIIKLGKRRNGVYGTPGLNRYNDAETSRGLGDFYLYNQYGPDIYGLKKFLGGGQELLSHFSMNAPWGELWKYKSAQSSWEVDQCFNIMQRDGTERKVPSISNAYKETLRMRFGRFCDMIGSSVGTPASGHYAKGYAVANGGISNSKGQICIREINQTSNSAELAYLQIISGLWTQNAYTTSRLCFWGEIENEDDIK